jgi:carboxyvinyl-carboxyphosphonate phosphorylmutase
VLTLTEFAQQAYRINRAGSLPLCVDADHGYGNAMSVKRTVEELETAGVSALTIEDTLLPTAFGGEEGQLLSIEEGVGKMRAALAGRQDSRLIIVGRTSAIGITGVEDTIARLKAYEAVGVDMLFIAGLKNREQLDAVASAVNKPLFLGSVPEDMMDLDYLSARKVRVCLQGHHQFWAGVQGVYNTLKALREGTKPSELKNVASADMQKKLLRQADYAKWSKDFLKTK